MRIGRVLGTVTMNRMLSSLQPGRYLICEALDQDGLLQPDKFVDRKQEMPESLVVFDRLGAGVGQLIAFSEGREASVPFLPKSVPMDAYSAAIIDTITLD